MMYIVLEEELTGRCGDTIGYRSHLIHIGWLTDYDALMKMEDEFYGYEFYGMREKPAKGDIVWNFNRLTPLGVIKG
jgi:hypothetical protein